MVDQQLVCGFDMRDKVNTLLTLKNPLQTSLIQRTLTIINENLSQRLDVKRVDSDQEWQEFIMRHGAT